MLKVHLHQIPEGDTLHLEGEVDPSFLELEKAGMKPIGKLYYNLDVGVSGSGFFATGTLSQKGRMTCVGCLEFFEYEFITRQFAMQRELEGSELVDLTFEVREDIHLLLPMHPRCTLGEEKNCPVQFSQHVASSLEASEVRPVWAALDHIKL